MARPLTGPRKDSQLVVRLSPALRGRVEAVRAMLSKRAGGVELLMSHIVREALERGLDALEREHKSR